MTPRTVHLDSANPADYMTVRQAAGAYGLQETTVYQYQQHGKLTRFKYFGKTLVSKQELNELKRRERE